MSGTKAGGKKAAKTNMSKYGTDFYKKIGETGGKNSKRKPNKESKDDGLANMV